jgi:hypothetical protein
MFAVIRYGPGLLAAGSDGEGAEQDGAIWASADGLTWTHIPGASFRVSALGGFGQKHIQALIPFGDYLMALGARSADGNEDADVWLAKVPKSQGSD